MQLHYRQYDLQMRHRWAISTDLRAGTASSNNAIVLIELRRPDGLTGLGEAAPYRTYGDSATSVMAFLDRVDPNRLRFEDVPGSMAYLRSLTPCSQPALCALNIALIDAAARLAGQPVHEHLGLPFENNRHLTSVTIGIDSPGMMARKALEAAAFPILKLKLGSPSDRENFAAVRAAAPGKRFRVDANAAWRDRAQALREIEWLAADGGVEYVEQPMPPETAVADMAWLRERSPLPVYADESYQTAADAPLCARLFHGVNVKLVKTGGIDAAKAALEAARAAGLGTMIGCMMESSLLITAGAHLAALADHLDLDSPVLVLNDPCDGVVNHSGLLSFPDTLPPDGLRVRLNVPVAADTPAAPGSRPRDS